MCWSKVVELMQRHWLEFRAWHGAETRVKLCCASVVLVRRGLCELRELVHAWDIITEPSHRVRAWIWSAPHLDI